jgi:hypothetical protein
MLPRTGLLRRDIFFLVGTLGLLGGLLVGIWVSMRPESMLNAPGTDAPQQERRNKSTALPQSTLTSTVYLPLVANKHYAPPPVFGVQEEFIIADSQGLTQVVDAGVNWVRFAAFHWDEIEPVHTQPPTYRWETVDEQSLRNAAAAGLDVIAVIVYSPEWAQKVRDSFCGPILEDRLDEFAEFLQALVERYSLPPYNVRYWELGNEVDVDPLLVGPHSGFGCWGDNTDEYYGGGYYAEMLKVAYPAIKAADPHAQVLLGGLLLDCDPENPDVCSNIHGVKTSKFLEGILRNDGGPCFDIVSFHVYTYFRYDLGRGHMTNLHWPGSETAIPEKVSFVREVLTAYGYGDKRLMNTEGALLCPEATEDCLETQAMYIPRAYAEALALGLEQQTYYAITNEHWRHTGLLLPDLTPKPVYYAYKTASAFLSPAAYVGVIEGYPAGIAGYTFHRRGGMGYLDVIWSQDGSVQEVNLPPGASVHDRYGTLVASSGMIEVDYSPVYVIRP